MDVTTPSASIKRGPWTPEEDQKLINYIQKHGHGSWRELPKLADLNRCGKSCRLRWINYLRPDIKRGNFSDEEQQVIINLHSILGNKWSTIAANLPGRTDNDIKNFWNTHLRKKLLQMGIDPVTHKPTTDQHLSSDIGNLPLLLSGANPDDLMSPWGNPLSFHIDAIQLAKIHNLIQVLHNLASTSFQQHQHKEFPRLISQFEGHASGSLVLSPKPSESPIVSMNNNHSSCSYAIPTANSIRGECFTANQLENKIISTGNSTSSPNFTTFETCGVFNPGDQAVDSYWRDIMEQTSSPSWQSHPKTHF